MIVSVVESNPIQICFTENRKLIFGGFLIRHCLKVSLSRKLILSQFSQKKSIFFMKIKQKLENRKQKEKTKILNMICLLHIYFKSCL